MKMIKTLSFLCVFASALTGCQLGVLTTDIGIGFESGAYVVSDTQ